MVLMGVLCRKVCEEVTTGGKPGLQATAWAFLLMNGLISKQEFKPTTFNMKKEKFVCPSSIQQDTDLQHPPPRFINHIRLGLLTLVHLLVEWPGRNCPISLSLFLRL